MYIEGKAPVCVHFVCVRGLFCFPKKEITMKNIKEKKEYPKNLLSQVFVNGLPTDLPDDITFVLEYIIQRTLTEREGRVLDMRYGLIDGIDRNAVEEEVKAQIDYDCLMSFKDDSVVKMVEEIKDLMVDVLCGERTVISEGKRVSEETAKAAYRKITFEHVQYVLHSLVNYPDKISRIDRFLTTSLFNSVYTMMNSTFAGFEHDMGMKLLL